jgi:1-acyl-sn-glycerol-3-phosphate acyltransferase
MAQRAGVPIQLVRITTDSDVLTKGQPWWRLPKFPAHVAVIAGPLLSTARDLRPKELAAEAEAWFHSASPGDAACAPPPAAVS